MKSCITVANIFCLVIAICLAAPINTIARTAMPAGEEAPEWRTWTSQTGAEIEAYLKEVHSEEIVIVRRDGQEFTAPLSRFSDQDRAYVVEWLQEKTVGASDFRQVDFANANPPNRHTIENVQNVRPASREPPESGAVQAILNFHGITLGSDVTGRITAREVLESRAIAPRDLLNALVGVAVEGEVITGGPGSWRANLNAIQTAVSWDFPVLLAYRPEFEPDTPEVVVVVVGYDSRNLMVLEPLGSNRAVRLDVRSLNEQFVHAIVLFPTPEPAATALATGPAATSGDARTPPPTELLSRISAAIREAPEYHPEAMVEYFNSQELRASIRDVNRSDLRTQLGQTRSFARTEGLPLIDASLDGGHVIVIPLEREVGQSGFALIYDRTEDAFQAVEFSADRSFNRAPIPRTELARRWITRDDRTYRLDLIEIEIVATGRPTPPRPPTDRPPANEPPPRRAPAR